MKLSKLGIVAVIAVVAILVVGYLAIVGYTIPVPDFKQSGGSSGGSSDSGGANAATYIAYATVSVGYDINPYTGLYSGTQPTEAMNFAAISINPSVAPYVSMSQGQVFIHQKLQMDWGGEGGTGGTGTPYVQVQYYAVVSISGSSGTHQTWQSQTMAYTNPQWSAEHFTFTSGRAFFQTPGTYQATVTFYQYIGGTPVTVLITAATSYVNFEVIG